MNLPLLFLLAAVVMTSIGGYLDMVQKERLWGISKQHAWNDGLFLAVAAIALLLLLGKSR